MNNIFEIDNTFVASTYKRFPLNIVKGKGSLVYDETGKEYIDMGSGIGVTAFGIADDEWINAVSQQLGTLQHMSNLYYTDPCALLAKTLCEKTGFRKVFFSNSGAEANECAIKVARKYAQSKKGEDYYTIITLKNSFHGRTLTTLAATGQDVFHSQFTPLTEGFVHTEPGDIAALEKVVKENKTAAVMLECIQGEGGVLPLNADFVKAARKICDENDCLLIIDEVQTGNGRTGQLYAYMNFGIMPDVISTAKGLGGGLPIGATLLGEKVKDIFTFSDHGSTFGGNPVCAAGALNIINRLTPEFLKLVKAKSDFIFRELNGAKGIENVSGMGLMVGIKTVRPVSDVIKECMENGVLPLTAKDKLRLLPALNIDQKCLEKAIDVIKTVCAKEN